MLSHGASASGPQARRGCATPIRRRRSTTVELADGRRLHARVWQGHGTPLVLLHGVLDSSEGWADLCESTARPCVAIDLGGFGKSDLPARTSFAGYANDVVEAMNEVVPGDVVLIGHSFGGAVAAAVAELVPTRVRALVLLAPAGFGRIPLAEVISIPGVRTVAERLMPLTLTSRAALTTAYRTMIANGREPSEAILERVLDGHATLVPGAVEATKAVVRGGLSRSAFHRRRVGYDGTVVAVWGDRDRLVPMSHAAGVATAFPQAELHVWPGMGHHPQVERPGALADLVEETCRHVEEPVLSQAA